jgi:RHS repeat-associated protein
MNSYDAQNRLLSATRGSGGSADTMEVVYDPWNRPIYRTVNGQKLFYVWDGWDLVGERTEAQYQAGEYQHVYVHGAEVDEILTTQQGYGGARRFHHHDALGSVIALTDDTGALLESYTHDVFGTPQVFDAAGQPVSGTQHGNRFLYTGREWIAELSLYDYRNRVYSAEIGRFMQTDPIGFAGGDINLYGYVGNGAADWSDPSGLSPYYPPPPPTSMDSGDCPPMQLPPIEPPPIIPLPPPRRRANDFASIGTALPPTTSSPTSATAGEEEKEGRRWRWGRGWWAGPDGTAAWST